jgi:hypothetical protein
MLVAEWLILLRLQSKSPTFLNFFASEFSEAAFNKLSKLLGDNLLNAAQRN